MTQEDIKRIEQHFNDHYRDANLPPSPAGQVAGDQATPEQIAYGTSLNNDLGQYEAVLEEEGLMLQWDNKTDTWFVTEKTEE